MALLKYADFEAAAVTGVRGFDTLSGTELAINASSPLYGTRDILATFVAGNSYGSFGSSTLTGGGKTTLFAVINGFRFSALPASDSRISTWRNSTPANVMQTIITSTGKLKLTCGTISNTGATTLTVNTTYRIGIKYVADLDAGSPTAIGEIYVAAGNAAFGAAEALTAAGDATTAVVDARFGWTAAVTMGTMRFDNIILNDSVMPGINGAALDITSPTYANRVTDAVAFPNWIYSGDSGDIATAVVEHQTGGGGYSADVPYYDRATNTVWSGHNVDFGSGAVLHKGVIALTANTSYDFRATFTCAEGVIKDTTSAITTSAVDTVRTKSTLTRLNPMTHSGRGTRYAPTAWFWNGSASAIAATIKLNAWIVMTDQDQSGLAADMGDVRGAATDIPIYQYVAPEIERDTGTVYDIDDARNTIVIDATAQTAFETVYAGDPTGTELWFAHDGGTAMTDRVYNANYFNFIMNWTIPGLRSWAYGQFMDWLYRLHSDAVSVATRFNGIIWDNYQGSSVVDQAWRSGSVAPVVPDETAIDTAVEIRAAYASFFAFCKATGTYMGANHVNATNANNITASAELDVVFLESTMTSYSNGVETFPDYYDGTNWKAAVDNVIAVRDGGADHVVAVVQMGTAPTATEVDFALWSFAMVTDGLAAGGKVIVRPADNTGAGYGEENISDTGTLNYDVNWGTPIGAYEKLVDVGAGDDRVYKRVFTGGAVWFNPGKLAGTLQSAGGPSLAQTTGQFVAGSTRDIKRMALLGVA